MRPMPPLNPPLFDIAKFDLSDGLIIFWQSLNSNLAMA